MNENDERGTDQSSLDAVKAEHERLNAEAQAVATQHDDLGDFASEVDANIGRNLRAAREGAGMSQSELARQVSALGLKGIHQTTIARIENGLRSLRAAEALAFVRVLETSIELLAESRDTSDLRELHSILRERSKAFDEALKELIWARGVVARQLDVKFPYGAEGVAPSSVVNSAADPRLYEAVEEALVSAAPHGRLENMYLAELHAAKRDGVYRRLPGHADKDRTEFVIEDMAHWLEVRDGEHQAEA